MDTSYYKKHSRETTMFHKFPEYVLLRDKLIPQAEECANQTCGLRPDVDAQTYLGRMTIQEWSDAWTGVFHRTMNKLAAESGLCQAR